MDNLKKDIRFVLFSLGVSLLTFTLINLSMKGLMLTILSAMALTTMFIAVFLLIIVGFKFLTAQDASDLEFSILKTIFVIFRKFSMLEFLNLTKMYKESVLKNSKIPNAAVIRLSVKIYLVCTFVIMNDLKSKYQDEIILVFANLCYEQPTAWGVCCVLVRELSDLLVASFKLRIKQLWRRKPGKFGD